MTGLRRRDDRLEKMNPSRTPCNSWMNRHPLRSLTMNASQMSHESARYELRFQSLFDEGRAYAFPCDAAGHVDLDSLGERARHNYFYARTVIGREFSMPAVRVSTTLQ